MSALDGCASFVGCVVCDRVEVWDEKSAPACCGVPMYAVHYPLREDNFSAIAEAAERAKRNRWERNRKAREGR